MALPIASTPTIYGKDARRFLRRMRASDMKPFLKTGCDMGWYGHFVGLVYVDPVKMRETIKKIINAAESLSADLGVARDLPSKSVK